MEMKFKCRHCKDGKVYGSDEAYLHWYVSGHNSWELIGVKMKIGISIGFMGKEWEFYWGKEDASYGIVELSGTVLTAKVSIYVRV